MQAPTTRQAILDAADTLFYEQGYEATSFADIASAVGIARGNFYHHFKTKDEILMAVIDLRMEHAAAMLALWEGAGDTPEDRIGCFIRILIANQAKIMLHGCPVGTLVSELAKLDHASRDQASAIFTLFRSWLARQFALLGCGADADDLALQLLARSQGVATLATAFRDPDFMEREVGRMCDWVTAAIQSGPKDREPKTGKGIRRCSSFC